MGSVIHLLGSPSIRRDGSGKVGLRGHKAWGLLAYLVRHPEGVSRQRLAALLFEDAEDPLAALRWNLSEVRRALGDVNLGGSVLALPAVGISYIDVDVMTRGGWSEALSVPGLGRDLLEGMSFSTSASFEVWIEGERRSLRATARNVLREGALARLAGGSAADAARVAAQLVGLDPLHESSQVLLVRCLAAAGDGVAAARQAAACRELFVRELGVTPSAELDAALQTGTAAPTSRPAAGKAGVIAQLQAGEAAIGAGVTEAGLQCLRRAIADADEWGDDELRVRARVALGGALVHAARGRDEEGVAALHTALTVGEAASPALAAAACRELGYVEMLRGSYERAIAWMDRATALATHDLAEQVRIATVRGSVLSDTAHYASAAQALRFAASKADEIGEAKQSIYATSMLGRVLLLCGAWDEAAHVLQTSTEQAARLWTAFLPWPQALLAEAELLRGNTASAAELFAQAFELGCQLRDPCWEGLAGRGLGRVAMVQGQADRAVEILLDALARCTRLPDGYLWARVYTLDALSAIAVSARMPRARVWVDELTTLASSAGMRELAVHGHLHRASLGDEPARSAARVLADEIDNPLLRATVGLR
jgi:DNA-binding SARP family transcriptional activator